MTTNISTSDKKWFEDLIVELRLRQVDGGAIGDTVASARELLDDTGQSAQEAFGPARDYAAALELPRDDRSIWQGAALWSSLAGLIAFLTFMQALVPWVESEPVLISPGQLALLGVTVILIALLPLYLTAAIRHPWILGLLLVIGGAAGCLSSFVAPATAEEAWMVLAATPWVVAGAGAMLLVAIGSTVRALRRGSLDDITDPRQGRGSGRQRSGLVLALVTAWLFPVFSGVMVAVAMLVSR
ncbi:hypothetical protein [Cryobacterium sp. PAMC25264]|uniref:hypothetical protein n=1 Tax=Cryobacterium sp. PAMC25264 TaxID=2861288 RepID=UPI001C625A4A|nr:hypothetical protein [Cryobacterium sp. PAMC25264]QYF73037.1 hypothetical protein KY500_14915 [Cryobacterium sp. PAMC25264]